MLGKVGGKWVSRSCRIPQLPQLAAVAPGIALGLLSTLSLLSMELAGRSYGGGVLKLEPSELARVRLVLPDAGDGVVAAAFAEADRRLRAGDFDGAVAVADELVLEQRLGLPIADRERLQRARRTLVERRLDWSGKRGRSHG
jgi:hypothetical protein